jgi:hypothetical protein
MEDGGGCVFFHVSGPSKVTVLMGKMGE